MIYQFLATARSERAERSYHMSWGFCLFVFFFQICSTLTLGWASHQKYKGHGFLWYLTDSLSNKQLFTENYIIAGKIVLSICSLTCSSNAYKVHGFDSRWRTTSIKLTLQLHKFSSVDRSRRLQTQRCSRQSCPAIWCYHKGRFVWKPIKIRPGWESAY